jgi:hypothetical protein
VKDHETEHGPVIEREYVADTEPDDGLFIQAEEGDDLIFTVEVTGLGVVEIRGKDDELILGVYRYEVKGDEVIDSWRGERAEERRPQRTLARILRVARTGVYRIRTTVEGAGTAVRVAVVRIGKATRDHIVGAFRGERLDGCTVCRKIGAVLLRVGLAQLGIDVPTLFGLLRRGAGYVPDHLVATAREEVDRLLARGSEAVMEAAREALGGAWKRLPQPVRRALQAAVGDLGVGLRKVLDVLDFDPLDWCAERGCRVVGACP